MQGWALGSFSEAFDKYIGRNSPAYVERMKFTPAEACALIGVRAGCRLWRIR